MTDDIGNSNTLGHLPGLADLRAMSPDVRTATLAHCLRLHLDGLLHVPSGHRTSPHEPLRTQGLDWLNALNLSHGIRRDLGVELGAQTLLDGTVAELAALLDARMAWAGARPSAAAAGRPATGRG
ncbi:hypothetical protein GPZ77_14510 [Streptomyces sp. QHH-9511]|uniref:acyl carrier protein n=1 Tax=Streptomyces sp. QHH-9511 TaxID=2684468 RepID=UPI0013197A04|nr:acyl carrier protein [Streptomyces sp. QHH-9511]QGZ49422.1 hypothetical protein GPZ77_14510 [Streptomyces sp. QHH-9511]